MEVIVSTPLAFFAVSTMSALLSSLPEILKIYRLFYSSFSRSLGGGLLYFLFHFVLNLFRFGNCFLCNLSNGLYRLLHNRLLLPQLLQLPVLLLSLRLLQLS